MPLLPSRKHREAVDAIAADNYLLRENNDAVVADTRKIRDSVTDMAEHILDNENTLPTTSASTAVSIQGFPFPTH